MTAWAQFMEVLLENGVDNTAMKELSPVVLARKDTLIPHLLEVFDHAIMIKCFKSLEFSVFPPETKKEEYKIIKSMPSFVIIEIEKQVMVFSVNPLSSIEVYKIDLEFDLLNIQKPKKIGFILPNDTALNNAPNEDVDIKSFTKELFTKVVESNASDVHIQPRNETHISFLFRIDGVLVESGINDVSNEKYRLIANEINDMFKLNTGAFNEFKAARTDTKSLKIFNAKQKPVDLRLQLNPLFSKFADNKTNIPNYIIRVTGNTTFKTIEDVKLLPEHLKIIRKFANHNNAGIFVVAPTNAGKTTLAYAIIAEMHKQRHGISIITVEDPVEVRLPNTQQMEVASQGKKDEQVEEEFDKALQNMSRSDPDAVFVGEIRSKTTANGVCSIHTKGSTVISTIHASEIFGVIDRLKNTSGVASFAVPRDVIANTVSVIIMPRLIRCVCLDCSKEKLIQDIEGTNQYSFLSSHSETHIRQATLKGCKFCRCGYIGRRQVIEIIEIDSTIKDMIIDNKSSKEMQQYAVKTQGQAADIWQHGLSLVLKGATTIEELKRVLPHRQQYFA